MPSEYSGSSIPIPGAFPRWFIRHGGSLGRAGHGEPDYRVVSDCGYSSGSMTRGAAAHWAGSWNELKLGETFSVEVRLVGVTDWEPCEGEGQDG